MNFFLINNLYRKDREKTVLNMAFKKDIISRRRDDLEPDCEIMVCDLQSSSATKTAFVP